VKVFDGITEEDIKEAAIGFAKQFGWDVKASDCRVQPIRPRPIREGGTSGVINLPISKWRVYLTSKNEPYVNVEQLSGAIAATRFWPIELAKE